MRFGMRPTVPFAVTAEGYPTRRRKRPLNATDIARIKARRTSTLTS
jgi:hypothetical protein